jgi:hypothetical protein
MAKFDHIHTFENGSKILIKHEPVSIPILKRFFKEVDPDLIVELGTSLGGLTMLMEESSNALIYTFDKHLKVYNMIHESDYFSKYERSTFILRNVLKTPDDELIALLKTSQKKILYCDNGNKALEMNMYCRCLNEGDIAGIHDWGTVGIQHEYVKFALAGFEEHSINSEFEKAECSSRFWIRKTKEKHM